MELKVQKTKDGIELAGSLPADIANADSLEVFPLRDGAYLFTVRGFVDSARAAAPSALEDAETALLKKLLAVRFEKRTPADVDRTLSSEERELLSSLLKKKIVTIFRSKKYERGVYNVSDAAFGLARGAPAPPAENDPLSKGYLVLESEGEARHLSNSLADRIKAGEISGLRAFDRKYYFIRKSFANEWQPKILSALEKGDKTAEELSREIRLDAVGCQALLLHMSEAGELLEKSKGKFALA